MDEMRAEWKGKHKRLSEGKRNKCTLIHIKKISLDSSNSKRTQRQHCQGERSNTWESTPRRSLRYNFVYHGDNSKQISCEEKYQTKTCFPYLTLLKNFSTDFMSNNGSGQSHAVTWSRPEVLCNFKIADYTHSIYLRIHIVTIMDDWNLDKRELEECENNETWPKFNQRDYFNATLLIHISLSLSLSLLHPNYIQHPRSEFSGSPLTTVSRLLQGAYALPHTASSLP